MKKAKRRSIPISVRFNEDVVALIDTWQKDTGAANRTEALESLIRTVTTLIKSKL